MSKKSILILHLSFWILFALVPELPMIFPDRKYPLYYYYYSVATQGLNVLNFYTVYFLISIDFLDFRIWPVFNVADASITIGAFILALRLIFDKRCCTT